MVECLSICYWLWMPLNIVNAACSITNRQNASLWITLTVSSGHQRRRGERIVSEEEAIVAWYPTTITTTEATPWLFGMSVGMLMIPPMIIVEVEHPYHHFSNMDDDDETIVEEEEAVVVVVVGIKQTFWSSLSKAKVSMWFTAASHLQLLCEGGSPNYVCLGTRPNHALFVDTIASNWDDKQRLELRFWELLHCFWSLLQGKRGAWVGYAGRWQNEGF